MPHIESQLVTHDHLHLRTQCWTPTTAPKAVLVHTHGHGEHSGRYGHVGQALSAAGFALYAYDVRGHGRSDGPRGHTPNLEALLDDLQMMCDWAKRENPGQKIFLLAHSMGGNTTVNYALRRKPDVAGVVLSSPWLQPTTPPAPLVMRVGRWLGRAWPTFTLNSGTAGEPLAQDAELLASFPDRHLSHTKITARMGATFFASGEYALAHAAEMTLPFIILQAGQDRLALPAASQAFYEHAASRDKTFRLFETLYHEIFNELERATVLEEVVGWLDARG